jgi:hypothetical protein
LKELTIVIVHFTFLKNNSISECNFIIDCGQNVCLLQGQVKGDDSISTHKEFYTLEWIYLHCLTTTTSAVFLLVFTVVIILHLIFQIIVLLVSRKADLGKYKSTQSTNIFWNINHLYWTPLSWTKNILWIFTVKSQNSLYLMNLFTTSTLSSSLIIFMIPSKFGHGTKSALI